MMLDENNPAHMELLQEINKRFKNKMTLYHYLVDKTVSSPNQFNDFECREFSCPKAITAL